ncbi:DoxX family membrane protein [Streptomyces sp. TLI_171]|uniref:DoxX family membrane protein n=1 Tax=Streptomyces sp. TLI_171 TaxID=1938859 RepID=UPI000C3E03FB|nr:DoxX family membrane protein [Streptomyces sp. TLI_171]RKE05058.1 thiosulfate dehydrogenase [quinone] large subunit [Streptomyces sp. TLI_171]
MTSTAEPTHTPIDPRTAGPGHQAARRALAAARVALGSVFLWAFLDKMFGLGYSTKSAGAWVEGGSPTKGFLSHVAAGPLRSTFHAWAGQPWVDWLFMLGLLGIGAALVAGVALRPAALSGTLLLAMMWAAEWPPARHLAGGAPSGSTNPLVDYHLLYALLLVVLAAAQAGDCWGLGRWWAALPVVRTRRWLR